jgi:hypothetical protein
VLNLSKFLLLQTAAPDAILRLEHADFAQEKAVIRDIYFKHQHHDSIEDFLNHYVHACDRKDRLLMQVCTWVYRHLKNWGGGGADHRGLSIEKIMRPLSASNQNFSTPLSTPRAQDPFAVQMNVISLHHQ